MNCPDCGHVLVDAYAGAKRVKTRWMLAWIALVTGGLLVFGTHEVRGFKRHFETYGARS